MQGGNGGIHVRNLPGKRGSTFPRTFPHAKSRTEKPGKTADLISKDLIQLLRFFCCRVSLVLRLVERRSELLSSCLVRIKGNAGTCVHFGSPVKSPVRVVPVVIVRRRFELDIFSSHCGRRVHARRGMISTTPTTAPRESQAHPPHRRVLACRLRNVLHILQSEPAPGQDFPLLCLLLFIQHIGRSLHDGLGEPPVLCDPGESSSSEFIIYEVINNNTVTLVRTTPHD